MGLKTLQKQTIQDLNDQGRLSEIELTCAEDYYIWFDCKEEDVAEFKALFFMLGITPEDIYSQGIGRTVTFFFHKASFK